MDLVWMVRNKHHNKVLKNFLIGNKIPEKIPILKPFLYSKS